MIKRFELEPEDAKALAEYEDPDGQNVRSRELVDVPDHSVNWFLGLLDFLVEEEVF